MHVEKLRHHISALKTKHTKLDEQIMHMEASGSFDDTEIHELKKQRLALKDQIVHHEYSLKLIK